MQSTDYSNFSATLKEDVRNLCWIQHKHDDDFMYIFCETKDALHLIITYIASNIDSYRKKETETSIGIVTTYNMHACELSIAESWVNARIIVPFSKTMEKGCAKIIALQSDIAESLCSSSMSAYLKCSTSCFVSNRVDILFLRLLQLYYDYHEAVNDITPIFQPLFNETSPLDLNDVYCRYDRVKLLEESKASVYEAER